MDATKNAELLRYALRDQLLTERDERVLAWAAQQWDPEAVEVVTTWIEIVRESAFLDGLGRRAPRINEPGEVDQPYDTGSGAPGNSGPGW